jgi:hypothetical protein
MWGNTVDGTVFVLGGFKIMRCADVQWGGGGLETTMPGYSRSFKLGILQITS